MKWDSGIDYDLDELVYLVETEWDCQWPGWRWVADRLNAEYGTTRSPAECRAKYARLMKEKDRIRL